MLVDTPALDGQLHTHDGQSVTFALDGSGDLVGTVSAGATEVIRIHLVSAAAGPGAGDVTYTYSTTLSQPLEHADGALENAITLTGVTVQVTDSDSDTLPVSFNVTIVDDVPQANNDGTFAVTEGTPLLISTALANDLAGADGVDPLTGVAVTTAAGKGTAVYNGDGTFTYTATAGQEGLDTFQYTITDRDGDTSTATVTVNLGTDSVPSLVSATNLTVDEDGFANAANDTLTARIDETDSTESLTATGTAVVNFGNDVPANLLGSIVLVDTPALDGQLHTHDGQSVTFALDGSGDLVGTVSAGATEVIRIHLVSAAAGPGAGDVTYTYSTTLSQPLEHADGALENAITLTGVTVQVTDSDSDTLPVSFNVTIVDDVPQANNDGTFAVTEGTPLLISTALANDLAGADGVDPLTGVAVTTAAGKGTAVYNGDGTFTYTATAGQEGLDTFQYTITDQDGDTSTATVTVNLGTDSVPSLVSATNLTVDEDGFANAANDTVTARTDETDSTESLTATGTAVVNFGNDVPANLLGSIVLVDTPALDGQLHTHDGQSVTFALDGSGDLVGTVSAGATEVIRIHLVSAAAGPGAGDVTYTYSTTLSQPLEHADGALENAITLTGVTVQVTDSDSDTLPVSFNVTIVDDVPQANNDGTFAVTEGTPLLISTALANDLAGADGVDPATGVAVTTAAGKGTAVYNGDGTFTYTATAGQEGLDTFQYTITDRDGDTSTATVTVNLGTDSVPSLVSATNLTVDEDGFANAANDTVTARIDETDSTESLTATGTAVVNFGNDVPANLLGSIVLVDTPALDGQLHTHDGQSVTFALDGSGDLVGTVSAGATEVIRIHLVSAAAGPGAGDVTYTYSTTLSQPLEHADGALENAITLTGVTVQVTDSDSDTLPVSFNVTIVDDVPQANNDGTFAVTEGTPLLISTALANDLAGADGVDPATGVAVTTAAGKGTAVYNGDGTFTYTATAGQEGLDTFQYTITDRDGDTSTATVTVNLGTDSVPSLVSATNLDG